MTQPRETLMVSSPIDSAIWGFKFKIILVVIPILEFLPLSQAPGKAVLKDQFSATIRNTAVYRKQEVQCCVYK